MNELLQKHGCSNVFTIPDGLRELMSDISREVLREQPKKITDFIANYLSALLITREHGVMAVNILDDLCDCRATVSEHLLQLGLGKQEAEALAQIIKTEIEGFEPTEGREKVNEMAMMQKILKRSPLDEVMMVQVCQVARNAYRDYWYRKRLLEQRLKLQPEEPWEIAAQHTLEIYKKTKPSFTELTRATQKIQAAYRGYYIRRNMLKHLTPKPKKQGPRVELSGPPVDAAASREIDLGPVIDIKSKVCVDNVRLMFDEQVEESLGLKYDPKKTITHVTDEAQETAEKIMSELSASGVKEDNDVRVKSAEKVPMETKSLPAHLDDTPKTAEPTDEPKAMSATNVETAAIPDVPLETAPVETTSAEPETEAAKEEPMLEVLQAPVEVFGDVADDATEPDSAPTTTIPTSSAPASTDADMTDAEDAGLTSADEGE